MPRKGSGEGSIFKSKRGFWCAAITTGTDARGRQQRRWFYGKTRKEVADKLARARSAQLDGILPAKPHKMKLGQYLDRWLEEDVRISTRPATYATYETTVRRHVKPHLGNVALTKVAPAHVQALLAKLETLGASPRQRQYVHGVLRRALGQAVRLDLLVRNPVLAVVRPRVPRKEIQPLGVAEVRKLLEAARGDPLEVLYVLAVTTGLRQGELLALRWEDVDLDRGTVRVRRTLGEVGGKLAFSEPKTAKARRSVVLPARAVEAVEAHRRRRPGLPAALVFADAKGGPLRKQNLVRRSFLPLLDRAKLRRIRFHDLRHTAATLLLGRAPEDRAGAARAQPDRHHDGHVQPRAGRDAGAGRRPARRAAADDAVTIEQYSYGTATRANIGVRQRPRAYGAERRNFPSARGFSCKYGYLGASGLGAATS